MVRGEGWDGRGGMGWEGREGIKKREGKKERTGMEGREEVVRGEGCVSLERREEVN